MKLFSPLFSITNVKMKRSATPRDDKAKEKVETNFIKGGDLAIFSSK